MQRSFVFLLSFALLLSSASCENGSGDDPAATTEAAPRRTVALVEPDADHRAEIEKYRGARESRLRQPDGWFSLVGLHFLEEGENPIGSDPDGAIVLPAGAAPARAGVLHYDGTTVRLTAEPGSGVMLAGDEVTEATLSDGTSGPPDQLRLGRLRMHLIVRNDRHALRVRDPEAATLAEFTGIDYYPINGAFKVDATLNPYFEPIETQVETVLGQPTTMLTA